MTVDESALKKGVPMPRKTESDAYSASLKAVWPPGRAGKPRATKPAPKTEPDALVRLEKWMRASKQGLGHWVHYIDPPHRRGAYWQAQVNVGMVPFVGRAKTLALAIHAALGQAEAKS